MFDCCLYIQMKWDWAYQAARCSSYIHCIAGVLEWGELMKIDQLAK